MRSAMQMTYKLARRLVIGFFGLTVLLVGVAMIVLPGPAFIVIPVGLGILGIEFGWARRWLKTVKDRTGGVVEGLLGSSRQRDPGAQ
jgi:Putative transmembrane protein (PGPGW)